MNHSLKFLRSTFLDTNLYFHDITLHFKMNIQLPINFDIIIFQLLSSTDCSDQIFLTL